MQKGFHENEWDVLDRSTCRTFELHIKLLLQGEILLESSKRWNNKSPAVDMPERCVELLWKRRNCKV